jgi:diguanylate cyclase (GGDEF)-like protein
MTKNANTPPSSGSISGVNWREPTRDPSTDSVDLKSLLDSGKTHTYSALTEGLRDLAPERRPVDANVILIAHPEGKLLGTRYRLPPGSSLEIGRSPNAAVSLPEVLSVSRNHARVEHQMDGVFVEDLGSTNGTYVNDHLTQGRHKLASGDRFQVGAVHFKFLQEADVEHAYHEAIYNLVVRDGLTEIYNKRKFDEEFAREFARATRYRRPLAMLVFDIDHFKAINDNYGHLCGDFVLKQIAGLARDTVRSEQIFARVGGEEFAVLCPETNVAEVAVLAEKLRQKIGANRVSYLGCDVRVTCSFGVAELAPGIRSAADLFATADKALYQSKQGGRDRVTVAAAPAATLARDGAARGPALSR